MNYKEVAVKVIIRDMECVKTGVAAEEGDYLRGVVPIEHKSMDNERKKNSKVHDRYFNEADVHLWLMHGKTSENSPGIVTLLGCVVGQPVNRLVIEYLPHTLGGVLNTISSFSASTRVGYVCQLLAALEWCHNKSLAHTDLSFNNVLVSDDYKRLVIIDFGSVLTKYEMVHDKHAWHQVSTPTVRAPEVWLGGKITFLIDLWAVGCAYIAMTTGFKGFNSDANKGKYDCTTAAAIIQMLGTPPYTYSVPNEVTKNIEYVYDNTTLVGTCYELPSLSIHQRFPQFDVLEIELLECMVAYLEKRACMAQAQEIAVNCLVAMANAPSCRFL